MRLLFRHTTQSRDSSLLTRWWCSGNGSFGWSVSAPIAFLPRDVRSHMVMMKMAKLRTVRPKVATLRPILQAARVIAEKQRLAERDETNDWRKWYYSARWQALSEQVLRDAAWGPADGQAPGSR